MDNSNSIEVAENKEVTFDSQQKIDLRKFKNLGKNSLQLALALSLAASSAKATNANELGEKGISKNSNLTKSESIPIFDN